MTEQILSIAEADDQMTAAGQMFEMDTVAIRGVEYRVWKHAPASLKTVLDLSLRHTDADFLVYEDERYTFGQHYKMAATMAHRLIELGVVKGDRVAVAARNLPEWVVAFWGSVLSGAITVPINAWWTGEELAYGLSDSGTKVAIVDEARLERIRPHLDEIPELETILVITEHRGQKPELGAAHARIAIRDFNEVMGTVADDVAAPAVEIDTDDDATIFYTSGTTGRPKGAVGTHRNAITNLMNLIFSGQRSTLRFGGGNVDDKGESIQNAYLLNIPLFHATGCLAVMIANTASGGKLVMSHHFDAGQALALIQNEKITTFGGVPTIAMQILDHPDFEQFDTSSVKSVSYGGAPAPPELVRRIRATFPGGQPGNGYGLTETSAAVALNSGPDYVAKPDCVIPAPPSASTVTIACVGDSITAGGWPQIMQASLNTKSVFLATLREDYATRHARVAAHAFASPAIPRNAGRRCRRPPVPSNLHFPRCPQVRRWRVQHNKLRGVRKYNAASRRQSVCSAPFMAEGSCDEHDKNRA